MSEITIRVVAKIDARNFLRAAKLPGLKNAVIGISYDIDLGDGATANCESEQALLGLMEELRKDFKADTRDEHG